MFESGLVDEWKLRTWMRMKAESQHESTIELDDVETLEALHLDDLQSVFILFALFITASVVTFLVELSRWRGSQRVKKGASGPGSLSRSAAPRYVW